MKKIIFVSCVVCFISSLSYSQNGWFWLNPLPTGNNINSVDLFGIDSVIMAGDVGTIISSFVANNSSNNWSFQNSNLLPNNSINDIRFANEKNGIIVGGSVSSGESGFIMYTTNGGKNWIYSLNGNRVFNRVFIVDSTLQFVIGNNSFLKSQNKGITWTNIALPLNFDLRGIDFINSSVGVIAGNEYVSALPPVYSYTRSIILRTTNGGMSWKVDSLGNGFQANDVAFVNNNKGFITCTNNILFRTTNSGISWFSETLNESNISRVKNIDSNRILLTSASGKLIKTSNGGANWSYQTVSTMALNDVAIDNSGTGFLVGEKGNIYRTIDFGSNWTQITSGALPVYNIEVFYGVHFIDNNIGTAVGTSLNGCVFHTTNGGLTWVPQIDINCQMGQARDVHFINSITGFIVGGGIQKTTNSGNNWFYVDVVTPGLKRIQFVNELTGFVAGGPRILKTTNGGVNWVFKYQSMGMVLNDMNFVGDLGIVVGDGQGGTILLSTDLGETWLPKYSGLSNYLYFSGVSTINDSSFVITDKEGKIMKSTDVGNTWRFVFSGSTSLSLNSVCFRDAYHGIVACNNGIILSTSNSGENWISTQANTISNFLKCSRRGENDFVVSGSDLTILSTSGVNPIGIQTISSQVPKNFVLHQNYPNPFNPQTKIKFGVPKASFTKLIIYDLLGREVTTLVNEELKPGTYEADWDASNLSSGVYFYKLIAGEYTVTKKMVLMK